MRIEFLGHSFFRVSFGKTSALIDPFINSFSGEKGPQRVIPCPARLEKMKKVDAILVSNENFDHFDKETIEFLAKRDDCIVVSHESLLQKLEIPLHQKKAVKVNEKFSTREIELEALPAHCPSFFYPLGFMLKKDGQSVYFAGDTSLTDNFPAKPNIALLPIGGTMTMDVVEAVKATKNMKPDYVVPMHYNTFDSIKADPIDFKNRIEKSVLKTVPIILKPGTAFSF